MRRRLYLGLGIVAFVVGSVGIALPLLPTVPFYILAAFCFGKGSPALERRLLDHPTAGPHIRAWRERGAISRRGKIAALAMLAASAAIGLAVLPMPWGLLPGAVAIVTGGWIATRP
ncbi:YbaN family protein [Sphingomonas profundi]|uniref:YbaN family protein n=1 Tax=Alterirhizorhabdus profundi TaxID=2681549 RepID=UPI0012E73D95|nr:YbaN family protein [Sphingomonas profundi]